MYAGPYVDARFFNQAIGAPQSGGHGWMSDEQLDAIIPGRRDWRKQAAEAEAGWQRRMGAVDQGFAQAAKADPNYVPPTGMLFRNGPVFSTRGGHVALTTRQGPDGVYADNMLQDVPTTEEMKAMAAMRDAQANEMRTRVGAMLGQRELEGANLKTLADYATGLLGAGLTPPPELLNAINSRIQERQNNSKSEPQKTALQKALGAKADRDVAAAGTPSLRDLVPGPLQALGDAATSPWRALGRGIRSASDSGRINRLAELAKRNPQAVKTQLDELITSDPDFIERLHEAERNANTARLLDLLR